MAKKAAKRTTSKKKTYYRRPKPYKRKTRASKDDGCFLTTACVEYKGLPDNCFQLEILRKFRDSYVKALPGGAALLEEYYLKAPIIVKKLKNSNTHQEELLNLFNEINRAVNLIRQGKYQKAVQLYTSISKQLEKKYL